MKAAHFTFFAPHVRPSRPFLAAFAAVALAASLAGCAHMPWAQRQFGPAGPATVAGLVSDDRGGVLVDAKVTLSGTGVRRTTLTDIAGHFTFERVPLGSYVLSASATGLKDAKQKVSVEKEGIVRADFKLRL